jgi:hypothetical protein
LGVKNQIQCDLLTKSGQHGNLKLKLDKTKQNKQGGERGGREREREQIARVMDIFLVFAETAI